MSDLARTAAELRKHTADWRAQSLKIGLVPTMGALHQGHLSLVERAAAECDRVIVSIFLNPKQFSASEDLDTYPHDEKRDLAALKPFDVSLVYAPSLATVYPQDFATQVEVGGLTDYMCGIDRPNFFSGVATVVTKLLIQCFPDKAYFGEKDFQQLLVIRRLTQDLDIPSAIIGCPIVRETDGLALSSRNAYLSPEERLVAPVLSETLREAAKMAGGGEGCREVEAWATEELKAKGFGKVDYVDIRDAATLDSLSHVADAKGQARIFAAATLGTTRLIDNMEINTDS
ncbi:MAG: pantoate--beta-alanine ligase [Rhodospirillaceae bacterium]|nr:pantoate--beta-alanine ligase [Rhodospirillaceae bacterium]HAA93185.1 pantoate--beta-alanine ligase [Rhodospirillaceae bacterium]